MVKIIILGESHMFVLEKKTKLIFVLCIFQPETKIAFVTYANLIFYFLCISLKLYLDIDPYNHTNLNNSK